MAVFFCLFVFLFFWRRRFFRLFCTMAVLSLLGEYVVFFPDGVFLPCDHGLDFDMCVRSQSISQSARPIGL